MIKGRFMAFLKAVDKNIAMLFVVFVLLNPIIDAINGLLLLNGLNLFFSLVVRSGALLAALLYVVFYLRPRLIKDYAIVLYAMLLYMTLRILCPADSFAGLFQQAQSVVKLFFYPMTLYVLYILFKRQKIFFSLKPLLVVAVFYTIILLVSLATNTAAHSYSSLYYHGWSGWFFSANELGAVLGALSLTVMVILAKLPQRLKIYGFLLGAAFTLASLLVGTKVPLFAIAISALALMVIAIINMLIFKDDIQTRQRARQMIKALSLFVVLPLLILFPVSPIAENLGFDLGSLIHLGGGGDQAAPIDKTSEEISRSLDGRADKAAHLHVAYLEAGALEQAFGFTMVDEGGEIYTAENDYLDIFYRFGFIGMLLYLTFPLVVLYQLFKNISIKKIFKNYELAAAIMGAVLLLGAAYISGHVISAPPVSFYVAFLSISALAGLGHQSKNNRVMFITSSGGHLSELLQLQSIFNKYDYFIVTEYSKTTTKLPERFPNGVGFLAYGSKDHLFSYFFKFSYNVCKSLIVYLSKDPKIIVTTGTHIAVPMCYFAKLFNSKVVFIETFANIETKTLSGRLVYPIADVFVVQWESMLALYPNAKYLGGVY